MSKDSVQKEILFSRNFSTHYKFQLSIIFLCFWPWKQNYRIQKSKSMNKKNRKEYLVKSGFPFHILPPEPIELGARIRCGRNSYSWKEIQIQQNDQQSTKNQRNISFGWFSIHCSSQTFLSLLVPSNWNREQGRF